MNDEMTEMMAEMEKCFDPMLAMARNVYKKMGNDAELWREMAKCMNTAVAAFESSGFSREESINMAIAGMNSIGKK